MYIHTTALRGITCGSTGDKRQFFNRIESCSSAGHQRSAWRHEDTNLCKTAKTWPEVLAPIQEKYIQLSHILVKIIILVTTVNREIFVSTKFWICNSCVQIYSDTSRPSKNFTMTTYYYWHVVLVMAELRKESRIQGPPYIYINIRNPAVGMVLVYEREPHNAADWYSDTIRHWKIFVLLIFGYQQAIWKFFEHWKFSDYRKSYTVWCHLMQIHHRCSSIHWLS